MLTKSSVIDAVVNGILEANRFYEKITAGAWLSDSGVESVLQTKIAESLFNILPKDKEGALKSESVILEYHINNIINESGSGKRRGRVPQLVSGAKRVDILICNSDNKPIIPIEIKRNASTRGFAEDAERILTLLGRSDKSAGGSVKFGLICGFLFGEGETELEALRDLEVKKEKCKEYLGDIIPDQNYEFWYEHDEAKEFDEIGWWVGGAICVYLRRN